MHLLPVSSTTLDEAAEAAQDLGQSPAEIVALSFTDSDLSALAAAWRAEREALPTLRLASLSRLKHPMSVDLYVEGVIAQARFVLVRCLGGLDYWPYGLREVSRVCAERGIPLAALPGCERSDPRLDALSTVDEGTRLHLQACLREGGPANTAAALRRIAAHLGRDLAPAEPTSVPAACAVDARGGLLPPIDALAGLDASKPFALLVFYRSALMAGDTQPVEALRAALETRGFVVAAVAVISLKDPAAAGALAALIERRRPDVILNATAFSAARDDGSTLLYAADCPVLQVMLAGSSREAWAANPRGLKSNDLAMNVVLPEADGRITASAISFKAAAEPDPDLQLALERHAPDASGIAYAADLAAAWTRLARTPRAARRLALILPDTPARGGRAGYAAGLDTPASVAAIAVDLRDAGYSADLPLTGDALMATLTDGPVEPTLSVVDYREGLAGLPEAFAKSVTEAWGDPEDDPDTLHGAFVHRIVRAGTLLVALQPGRGHPGTAKSAYHDPALPPRHAYVAFHLWLREQADALIQLGSHGTLEWLPGKAVALSEACAPRALLGALPVVYPFIVNNPGEAVPARRRLAAVTVSHLTPPLLRDPGLHGAAAEIEGLLDEYAAADGLDPRRTRLLQTAIVERALATGLAAECGVDPAMDGVEALTRLDAWLCDVKDLAIRDGLHVFARDSVDAVRAAPLPLLAAPDAASIARARLDACANAERDGLLAALDGRFVRPGPGGAPSRGRLDVLPTGRNLCAVDPRALPTRTAALIGAKAADEVLRRHLQDHGDWPRSVVIDLWASSTIRTGGEDLAQGLALIGAKPVWDHASNRVSGVETIPGPLLGRPRVDVTLRVSGLFRDTFPAQIALFDQAVRLIAGLDEDEEQNPLKAALRRGEGADRVFGSAPGTFGAGAASLALDGAWTAREDLGQAYLDASRFALHADGSVREAEGAFRTRVAGADALVHVQDDSERDLLDAADGVADYAGGFAAAAALLGASPALYHLDTSRPDAPKARLIAEEIARVVRGRLSHLGWIAGQLRHGHRGAGEIAQGVDALFALAATTGLVTDAQFDLAFTAIVEADEVWHAVEASNPRAAAAIVARFEESLRRGLWASRRNSVARTLDERRGQPLREAAK